ncbi:MAG: PilZ domain-containing protein [Candidatus Omnitrophica bacterium]|nr:PilZ domain-containing protein [Candidatus Omnitrophota bacterium]
MTQKKERRKYPRIKDKDISVKLEGEGFSTITQSLDVSASGIYCKVVERIPLMTRLQIVLSLPAKDRSSGSTNMDIEGVVVREHPVMKDGRVEHYDVAIFFNTLMPKERKKLTQYISRK